MVRSHKIQLKPRPRHIAYFKQACGTARFAWNWGLAYCNKNGFTSGFSLANIWTIERPEWSKEVCRDVQNQSFRNLDVAYKRLFKKISDHPKFKKRNKCKDSFYIINQKLQHNGKLVRIPKLGWVRMTQPLRYQGKIMSATVSREADRWFISITVEVEDNYKVGEGIIGVDLGVKTAIVCSDGQTFESPMPLEKRLRKLAILDRQLAKKQYGSKNREKAKLRRQRLYWRIKNQRRDFLHRVTSELVSKTKTIVIEDLHVEDMKPARAIRDVGFYAFRELLTYKCKDLVIADRYFPSSQLCNKCGARKKMPVSKRIYECSCGYVEDRDINAAKNLRDYTVKIAGINACGDETLVSSAKQEPSLRR
jgi:putative transposase